MPTPEEVQAKLFNKKRRQDFVEIDGEEYWLQTLTDLELGACASLAVDRKTFTSNVPRLRREQLIRAWITGPGPDAQRVFADTDLKKVEKLHGYITTPLVSKFEEMHARIPVEKKPENSTETSD